MPVTVPARRSSGGLGVQRAVRLIGQRRGLLGDRRMTVALATAPAPFAPVAAAPAGGGAGPAPTPPVVRAAWPHALASRPDGEAPVTSAAPA
ncbi:hypothetical protein ACWGJO_40545, partial [Kitasatospora sp. NPDC054795]